MNIPVQDYAKISGGVSGGVSSGVAGEYEKYIPLLRDSQKKKIEQLNQKNPSWWQKAISLLSTGETGSAAYAWLEGKNPVLEYGSDIIRDIQGKGYGDKTYADVFEKLGMKKSNLSELFPSLYSETGEGWKLKKGGFLDPSSTGALGLAADILLDPKTYLGGIGLFKRAGEASKGLTSAGKKLLGEAGEKGLKEATEKGLQGIGKFKYVNDIVASAEKVIKSDPDKFFKGITFMGKEIVPRKVALAPGRFADNLMSHIPILNKPYTGIKNGIQDLFKVGADVLREGKKLGDVGEESAEAYLKATDKMYKTISYRNSNFFNELNDLRKAFLKGTKKGEREYSKDLLRKTIEKNWGDLGVKADDDLIANIGKSLKSFGDDLYKLDAGARFKLEKKMYNYLSGYFPHIANEDGLKALSLAKAKKVKGYTFEKGSKLHLFKTQKAIENLDEAEKRLLQKVDIDQALVNAEKGYDALRGADDDYKIFSGMSKSNPVRERLISKYKGIDSRFVDDDILIGDANFLGLKNVKGTDDFIGNNLKRYKIIRRATLDEAEEIMSPLMKEAGLEGKKFFKHDPFEVMLERGIKESKKVAKLEYLESIKKLGIDGKAYKTLEDNALGQFFKYTPFTDENGIKYIHSGIEELGDTMLPDFLVKDLKKTVSYINDDNVINQLLKSYDKILGTWKGAVYGWFPSSHGRNFMGGMFNNWLAGLTPGSKYYTMTHKILSGADGFIDSPLYGKVTYKEIRDSIYKGGILEQTGFLDVNQLTKAFDPENWAKKAAGKVYNAPRKAMEFVENELRVPLYLKELTEGKTFDQAANVVFKYHFDYSPEALTQAEKEVFKRIIPFYKWTRENIPLMLEEFIAQPGKMTGVVKFIREATDKEGNLMREYLPSYIEQQLPITRAGDTITSNGLPLMESLQWLRDPVKQFLQGVTPFVKIPTEIATNYSTFKERLISEDTSGSFAKNYPESIQNWLEYKEEKYKDSKGVTRTKMTVNPVRKYWLYALPTSRIASLLTVTLDEEQKNKILYDLVGVKTYEFDKKQLREQLEKNFSKEIEKILLQEGIFGQTSFPYKSSKEKIK